MLSLLPAFFFFSPHMVCLSPLLQLQMLGYDVSWAAFNIVEVMSSSKFTYKVRYEDDHCCQNRAQNHSWTDLKLAAEIPAVFEGLRTGRLMSLL